MRGTKKYLTGTIITGLLVTGIYQEAWSAVPDDEVHRLILEMKNAITNSTDAKSAQAAICSEGKIFRRSSKVAGKMLPVVAYNCESYDFYTYGILACNDFLSFKGSTCDKKGIEVYAKRGEKPDVEKAKAYMAQAIKNGRPDPIALICDTPRDKLPGVLPAVAAMACTPTTPSTTAVTKPAPTWQAAKPTQGTKPGPIVIGQHRLDPPVVIVQGALRDLAAPDKFEIDTLAKYQFTIEDALRNKDLKAASKTGPEKAQLLQQEAALADVYKQSNTVLSKIQIELGTGGKKDVKKDLLDQAKKLNADLKNMRDILSQ